MKSSTEVHAANAQYLENDGKSRFAAQPKTPKMPADWFALRGIRFATFFFSSLALTSGCFVRAQQHYGPAYSWPYEDSGQYQSQYAQPGWQYSYGAQPQYQQPQYQQPQYAPPQQYADQQPYASPGYPPEQNLLAPAPAQALAANQLEQLLAPIALYPDALLAQIFAASTYPEQVSAADEWLQQMRAQGYGAPEQIAAAAASQAAWDASIESLTAFPDVLDMLSRNLDWTAALGNAYYNQPQDVMQTVQVLRQRAQQAGNLQTTPQENVRNQQGFIDITPPNPQVIYVPTYNPWNVYGQPISPYPGFSLIGALGSFFGSSPIQYALSFAMGAFGHTPFSLLTWGLDWFANAILFNHDAWNSNSTTLADWGLPHGGPRAFPGWRQPARGTGNFYRGVGSRQEYGQRNQWATNSSRPGSYVRPALGIPYNPRNDAQPRIGAQNRAFARGYQPVPNGYARPGDLGRLAYNRPAPEAAYSYRAQTYPNRPQLYASRPPAMGFGTPGYGYANGHAQSFGKSYASRPGFVNGGPYSSYRAPQVETPPTSSHRTYSGFGNPYGGMMAKSEHSDGFHLFGGGEKAPKISAPKYYKTPKSFGHQSSPKAPKMNHSGRSSGHHHF